jgi:AcrR family transcriptional regulator
VVAQQEPPSPAPATGRPKGTLNVARWGEILQAAGEVFDEKGYQAARIEDIAARVGILKGSLYYYIETKEDLLFALSENAHTTGLTSIVEQPELAAADAPTRLGAFVLRWMDVLAANPPYATVTDREVGALSGERYEQVMAKRNELHGFVRGLIEQGIANGDFDPATDPGVATNSVFQMLNATSGWFRASGRLAIPDIAEWYRTFVLRGLAAPSA